jgi:hypothetical protein
MHLIICVSPKGCHTRHGRLNCRDVLGTTFLRAKIYRGRLLTLITGSSSRLLRIRFSADLTMYWFLVCHFRCMKFKPLVIWIWNQNIAISTIVGTSSCTTVHSKKYTKVSKISISIIPRIYNMI